MSIHFLVVVVSTYFFFFVTPMEMIQFHFCIFFSSWLVKNQPPTNYRHGVIISVVNGMSLEAQDLGLAVSFAAKLEEVPNGFGRLWVVFGRCHQHFLTMDLKILYRGYINMFETWLHHTLNKKPLNF